ncbi:MAG: TraB/GumN family protein [Elusimicrobia bacterium]|nr:TraB/GumN family protein [Elusimicrobiota bacterium]
MNKLVKGSIIFSAVCFCISGCCLAEKEGKSFLWKLSGKDNYSYILGSVHIASSYMYPLSRAIQAAYDDSLVLAVEADVGGIEMERMTDFTLQYGIYIDGNTLREDISPELYEKVEHEMAEFGVDMERIDIMKPWLVGMTVMQMRLYRMGYTPAGGIDIYFLNRARDRKEIVELESVEYQLDLLGGFSDELQELILEQVFTDESLLADEMMNILVCWKTGDAEKMEEIMHRSFNEDPKFKPVYDKLIYERNLHMCDKIMDYIQDDKVYFIIVGALHLVGKDSLLKMLEKKGVTVEQL